MGSTPGSAARQRSTWPHSRWACPMSAVSLCSPHSRQANLTWVGHGHPMPPRLGQVGHKLGQLLGRPGHRVQSEGPGIFHCTEQRGWERGAEYGVWKRRPASGPGGGVWSKEHVRLQLHYWERDARRKQPHKRPAWTCQRTPPSTTGSGFERPVSSGLLSRSAATVAKAEEISRLKLAARLSGQNHALADTPQVNVAAGPIGFQATRTSTPILHNSHRSMSVQMDSSGRPAAVYAATTSCTCSSDW